MKRDKDLTVREKQRGAGVSIFDCWFCWIKWDAGHEGQNGHYQHLPLLLQYAY